jgi:phenylpyruvate tautomerase PptA (4-oxalocrotonate tautomerase family)
VPIIEITTLAPAGGFDVSAALGAVTTEVAAFLDEEPRGTWAIYRPIAPGHFAEGTDAPPTQPAETHPAIVRVFANRPPAEVPALLEAVGSAVVRAFGLGEGNVVVLFEAADPDRMFWG